MAEPSVAHTTRKTTFTVLDDTLLKCLDGRLDSTADILNKVGFTVSLQTCAEEGWPMTSLLGPGEVLATAPDCLMLALWPASRAHHALLRDPRATLTLVHAARFYQLHVHAERTANADGLCLHQTRLVRGEGQQVPYATLVSGIHYTLDDPNTTLAAWRRQIAALSRMAAAQSG